MPSSNNIFRLILLIIIINACSGEKPETDVSKMNLKGKVKSVKIYEASLVAKADSFEINKRIPKEFYEFDKKGRKIEEQIFDYIGHIFDMSKCKYDDMGRKTEISYFDEDKKLTEKYLYLFDKQDSIIKMQGIRPNGEIFYKVECEYDNEHQIIKKIAYLDEKLHEKIIKVDEKDDIFTYEGYKYDDYGNVKQKFIIKKDKEGKVIEQEEFDYEKNTHKKFTCEYNEQGKPVEKKEFNDEGKLVDKWVYKYDKNKNVIEEAQLYTDGSVYEKFTYKYDNNNDLLVKTHYGIGNKFDYKIVYKYDDAGNVINKRVFSKPEVEDENYFTEWTYVFDKMNNWIKKIEYRNKVPVAIVEREITYYKD